MIYKYVLKIVILDYFFVLFFNFQNRIFRFISDKYQLPHIQNCRQERRGYDSVLFPKYWFYDVISVTNIDLYFTNKNTQTKNI